MARDTCRELADLLVADTLHDLSADEQRILDEHLAGCSACRRLHQALREDDRRLSALVQSAVTVGTDQEERLMKTLTDAPGPAFPTIRPRRPWFARPLPRFALAAAVALAVLLGIDLLGTGGGGHVVWADVIAQVAEAQDFVCRRVEQKTGEPPLDIVEYRSATYGLRQDIYQKGRLQAVQTIVPDEKVLYAVIHRDHSYMKQQLTDEQVAEVLRQTNAREIVTSFHEHEYRSLGRRRIDGVMAEGIEIRDPVEWRTAFEHGAWRLWVDVATGWPIRLELEGEAAGGSLHKTYLLKDFQWNPTLTKRDFAVEIPEGYTLIADMGPMEATEDKAIEGLRSYAELMDGRYPSSLAFATAIAEVERHLKSRHDRYDEAAGRDVAKLFALRSTCDFYNDLVANDGDPAYHGDTITRRDFDRILMRWRLDDGRYRVVWGDLRRDIVGADELAELECPR